MNANFLFQDIESGALTEVQEAACSYYDEVRGLTARQQFFIYPDDTTVCLTSVDGGNAVSTLTGDNLAYFRHYHPAYFNA
jgi:hypothetical protein